ncbi:MAG: hypothetical protein Q8M03_09985 [Legionella sp.]|nr:hypothetical protein [Legionella sp.]
MTKYLVTCAVNFDGRGDWTHCRDILQFMQTHDALSGITLIPFIAISYREHPSYESIFAELVALCFPDFFWGTKEDFQSSNVRSNALKKLLPQIDQVIIVSNDNFVYERFFLRNYDYYLKPDVLIKFISEHEGGSIAVGGYGALRELTPTDNIMIRSMGLDDFCYGINVKKSDPMNKITAWDVIQTHDAAFVADLLRTTQTESLPEFLANHLFIPAYFNSISHFSSFIGFLATNAFIPKQDIAMYLSSQFLSGINLGIKDLEGNKIIVRALNIASNAVTGIKQFVLIEPGKKPSVYPLARQGRTIRFYLGYHLSDPSFAAAFNSTNFLVGVSGDNTFQKAVAEEVFPFYCSTNIHLKRATLPAIGRIAQLEELDIPQSVREDYRYFFNDANFWGRLISHNERGVFDNINLPEMIEYWPLVANYIKTHCNLQTRLLQIILEKPDASIEQKPVRMDGQVLTYDLDGKPKLVSKEAPLDKTSLPSPPSRYEFMPASTPNDDDKEVNVKSCGL